MYMHLVGPEDVRLNNNKNKRRKSVGNIIIIKVGVKNEFLLCLHIAVRLHGARVVLRIPIHLRYYIIVPVKYDWPPTSISRVYYCYYYTGRYHIMYRIINTDFFFFYYYYTEWFEFLVFVI